MIRRPPRSTQSRSSAASDVYKRQDDVLEVAPLDVFHHQVVGAVLDAPVVDVDDIGLVEVGGGLGLLAEPGDEHLVFGELGVEYLHRDCAAEQVVAGPVDIGHAARADQLFELIPVSYTHLTLPTIYSV